MCLSWLASSTERTVVYTTGLHAKSLSNPISTRALLHHHVSPSTVGDVWLPVLWTDKICTDKIYVYKFIVAEHALHTREVPHVTRNILHSLHFWSCVRVHGINICGGLQFTQECLCTRVCRPRECVCACLYSLATHPHTAIIMLPWTVSASPFPGFPPLPHLFLALALSSHQSLTHVP